MQDSEVRWQDEILEVMYWMRGEHLGQQVTRDELLRFLSLDRDQLDRTLSRLVATKLLVAHSPGNPTSETFELSERGIEEGGRRFREEFSPYLGRPSHLTCDDPACDCNAADWDGVCPSIASGS
jgi:hypothetical protein